MIQELDKESVIEALLTTFKEIQTDCEGEEEVLITSKPASDFLYIDSEVLLQATGMLAEELGIDIPKKCQLFLGANGEELTIEQVAEKLIILNSSNGSK